MSENKESWFYKLIPFGFAPGSYERKCAKCERAFLGDKRATGCVSCATITQQAKEIDELKGFVVIAEDRAENAENRSEWLMTLLGRSELELHEYDVKVGEFLAINDLQAQSISMLNEDLDETEKELVELRAHGLRLMESLEQRKEGCPNCDNIGWYMGAKNHTGDPEQIQCEFCYTNPVSVFSINETLKETPEQSLAAHDLIKRNEVIEEVLRFVDDGTDWLDNSEVFAAIRNLKTTQD